LQVLSKEVARSEVICTLSAVNHASGLVDTLVVRVGRVLASPDAVSGVNAGLLNGCLLTTRNVADAVIEGRLPGGDGLRLVELADDYRPRLELVTGIVCRRHERDQ
jgi:hypothetical protein